MIIMSYNFDLVIDRSNTNSVKHDFAKEHGKSQDLLPMWVADMDFKAADEIIEAVADFTAKGIFGYSEPRQDYYDALIAWYKNRFGWNIEQHCLVSSPGIVPALCTSINAFTKPGDKILIQPPVYPPFSRSILANGRVVVENSLKEIDGHYEIDFVDFEAKIKSGVKLFLLCSPHNPIGRVWNAEELQRMGELCVKNGVIIVSDEIHSDFIFKPYKHTVFSNISDEFAQSSVICTAPSKTFNIAGLQISNIYIKNDDLRTKFKKEQDLHCVGELSCLGIVACKAAYEKGEKWLEEFLEYIQGNFDLVNQFIAKRLPMLKATKAEGTYLMWMDFRALNLSPNELDELLEQKAKVWFNEGSTFGAQFAGFKRINLACPRSIVDDMLSRLEKAIV